MTDNLLDNRAKAFNDGGLQRFLACDPFEELVVGRFGDDDLHTRHGVVDLNVSGGVCVGEQSLVVPGRQR